VSKKEKIDKVIQEIKLWKEFILLGILSSIGLYFLESELAIRIGSAVLFLILMLGGMTLSMYLLALSGGGTIYDGYRKQEEK